MVGRSSHKPSPFSHNPVAQSSVGAQSAFDRHAVSMRPASPQPCSTKTIRPAVSAVRPGKTKFRVDIGPDGSPRPAESEVACPNRFENVAGVRVIAIAPGACFGRTAMPPRRRRCLGWSVRPCSSEGIATQRARCDPRLRATSYGIAPMIAAKPRSPMEQALPVVPSVNTERAQVELEAPMQTVAVEPPFLPASVTGSHA